MAKNDQAMKKLEDVAKQIEAFEETLKLRALNILRNEIVIRTPVRTGRLRASITIEEREDGGIVGTNVFYAPFVEFGHKTPNGRGWVPGRFMFLYGTLSAKKKIENFLSREVNSFFKKALS